jgi:hypothetical protein
LAGDEENPERRGMTVWTMFEKSTNILDSLPEVQRVLGAAEASLDCRA